LIKKFLGKNFGGDYMNGQGSLIKRGNTWTLVINIEKDLGTGKYKQKWVKLNASSKTEAEKERIKILAEIQEKGFQEPSKQTYGEWLGFWLNEIAKPNIKPNTYDFYEYLIRIHIKPRLGNIPLKKLLPDHLLKFYNEKRQEKRLSRKKGEEGKYTEIPLSLRTVRGMQIVNQIALDEAVKKWKILINPNDAIDVIKYKNPEAKYLTSDEVVTFLGKISEDRWFSAFIFELGSGLRAGELTVIKWDKLDLQKGKVSVVETATMINTYENKKKTKLNIQDPKSAKGFRTVPLPIDVIYELKRWKAKQIEEKIKLGPIYQNDLGYVFTWPDGRMVDPGYLSKHFKKLIRKYGFDGDITFHCLRHSYATMLIEKGEDLKVIQENLGHADLATTSGIYAHVLESMKEKAARKLDGFSGRSFSNTIQTNL
jgi:integrase